MSVSAPAPPPLTRARSAVPPAPARPWLLAAAVAAGLTAAVLLGQLAVSRVPFGTAGEPADVRIAIIHCLMIGYAVGALRFVLGGVQRRVAAIAPSLDLAEAEHRSAIAAAGRIGRRTLVAAFVAGAVIAFAGPYLSGEGDVTPWDPSGWSAEVVWHRVLGLPAAVLLVLLGIATVIESTRMSRLAARLRPIDLLRLEGLTPFTQQGLANALAGVGAVSVFLLFVYDQGITPLVMIASVATTAAVVAALLLPLRGVRSRIREAKARELAWVDVAAAAARDRLRAAVAAGDADPAAAGRLSDLLAWRATVERIREWPLDQSAVARVVLYLAIPLLSWLASTLLSALFERALFG